MNKDMYTCGGIAFPKNDLTPIRSGENEIEISFSSPKNTSAFGDVLRYSNIFYMPEPDPDFGTVTVSSPIDDYNLDSMLDKVADRLQASLLYRTGKINFRGRRYIKSQVNRDMLLDLMVSSDITLSVPNALWFMPAKELVLRDMQIFDSGYLSSESSLLDGEVTDKNVSVDYSYKPTRRVAKRLSKLGWFGRGL